MSNKKQGGPAFPSGLIDPSTPDDAVQSLHQGMTLRDYFAAKAMPIAAGGLNQPREDFVRNDQYSRLAQDAYKLADAMMDARQA
jgi:hypothetical protein